MALGCPCLLRRIRRDVYIHMYDSLCTKLAPQTVAWCKRVKIDKGANFGVNV